MNDACRALFKNIMIILVAILAALILSIVLAGCRTTRTVTETVTKTDTVTIRRDSIIIRHRIDTVTLTLPVSAQTIEMPIEHDTVSVLQDKYYTSVAAVENGRLRHALRSNPGASLSGAAVVHDTIKVYVDSTMINNNQNVATTEEKEVNKPPWWMKMLAWIGGISLAAGGAYIYLRLKK